MSEQKTTAILMSDFQSLAGALHARGFSEQDLQDQIHDYFRTQGWRKPSDSEEEIDQMDEESDATVYLNLNYVRKVYGEPSTISENNTGFWSAIPRLPPGVILILDNPCVVKQDDTCGFRLISENNNQLDVMFALEKLAEDYQKHLKR